MENIRHILKQVEAEYKIEVLYACETGSRAWGFPSPNSDYESDLFICTKEIGTWL